MNDGMEIPDAVDEENIPNIDSQHIKVKKYSVDMNFLGYPGSTEDDASRSID